MRGRLAVAACVFAAACAAAGGAGGPSRSSRPVLAEGPITRADEAEAERLYASAQSSFDQRRFFEVLRTTSELMERFPGSTVSGAALLMTQLGVRHPVAAARD